MLRKVILKIKRKLRYLLGFLFFQKIRILWYKLLSNIHNFKGKPILVQPVLFYGQGTIKIGKNVIFGVHSSPFLFSGYAYIEARNKKSIIEIGENTIINNNCVMISDGEGIYIGPNTLIGTSVEIIDSDFHNLHPDNRLKGIAKSKKVHIEENVFIGSNVKILKGVVIGKNSIIGNGAIVTKSIPENSIATGNPAKVVKKI